MQAGAELIELQDGVTNSEHDGGRQRRWVFYTKLTNIYLNSPRHFFFSPSISHATLSFIFLPTIPNPCSVDHMHSRGDLLASSEFAKLLEIKK